MNEHADESARTRLPIEQLPLGEVAPPLELDHESWPLLAGWDDPLAPRGGCRLPSGKTRIDYDGVPAIEWMPDNATERPPVLGAERALTTGEPTWREYTVECRLQALETRHLPYRETGPGRDPIGQTHAGGIVERDQITGLADSRGHKHGIVGPHAAERTAARGVVTSRGFVFECHHASGVVEAETGRVPPDLDGSEPCRRQHGERF